MKLFCLKNYTYTISLLSMSFLPFFSYAHNQNDRNQYDVQTNKQPKDLQYLQKYVKENVLEVRKPFRINNYDYFFDHNGSYYYYNRDDNDQSWKKIELSVNSLKNEEDIYLSTSEKCLSYTSSSKSCPDIMQLKNRNYGVFSTENGEWVGVANNSALDVRIEKFDSALFRPSAIIRELNTGDTVLLGEHLKCSYKLSDENFLDITYRNTQTKYRKLINMANWQAVELFGTITHYECKSTPNQCKFIDVAVPILGSEEN